MQGKIICFGELLIDFVALERDVSVGHAKTFEKAAGGAPANVAVGLAKLGIPTAFVTQMGNDPFGHFLAETVAEQGVDTSGVIFTDDANTALAFVAVEASGERSFAFYRNPSADMLMTPDSLNKDLLAEAAIFHYGSITLIDDPVRQTTLEAIQIAREHGAVISYDPNLRSVLWPSLEAARRGIREGLAEAEVVKMNVEELAFLTEQNPLSNEKDIISAAHDLWHQTIKLMVITMGSDGCLAVTSSNAVRVEGFSVTVEDTIGAGDGFMAGLLAGLYDILNNEPQWTTLTPEILQTILKRANAVGALTASRRGGIPALPPAEAVDNFLSQHS